MEESSVKAVDTIASSIVSSVQTQIKNAPFDKIKNGILISYTSKNTCEVKVEGEIFETPFIGAPSTDKNINVKVIIPQNVTSNMFTVIPYSLNSIIAGINGSLMPISGDHVLFENADLSGDINAVLDNLMVTTEASFNDINVNKVSAVSDSGNLVIKDNTIKIIDQDKKLKVQIGEDVDNNDYNIQVFNDNGSVMFNGEGIQLDGIKDGVITSNKLTIADAYITNAMIKEIEADKITSGIINTKLLSIESEEGNLSISDNTIAIKDDDDQTRVQIGKDPTDNDYNIQIYNSSGDTMFDVGGVTSKGINNNAVQENMIDVKAVTTSKIDTEAITEDKISAKAVVAGKIDANAVTATEIATGTITANEIATGTITANEIKTNSITSDKLQVADAFIKDAMIDNLSASKLISTDAFIENAMVNSLSANKLTSGTINTNLLDIKSNNGNLLIADNTIAIKDDNDQTRVQIGKDTDNDYNIVVNDSSGNVMFNTDGLTSQGIKSGIIRNDMISSTAGIVGGKLDIPSVADNISSGLEDGTAPFNTDKFRFDEEGITINNGGFKIKNSESDIVLEQDTSGNLSLSGNYSQGGDYGDAITIEDEKITFYNHTTAANNDNSQDVGRVKYEHFEYPDGTAGEFLSVQGKDYVSVVAGEGVEDNGTIQLMTGNSEKISLTSTALRGGIWSSDGENPTRYKRAILNMYYDKGAGYEDSYVETNRGCEYDSLTNYNDFECNGSTISRNKFGNFVCLNFIGVRSIANAINSGTGDGIVMGGLPIGYRPLKTIKGITREVASGQNIEWQLRSNGDIICWNNLTSTTTKYIYFNVTFPTEANYS